MLSWREQKTQAQRNFLSRCLQVHFSKHFGSSLTGRITPLAFVTYSNLHTSNRCSFICHHQQTLLKIPEFGHLDRIAATQNLLAKKEKVGPREKNLQYVVTYFRNWWLQPLFFPWSEIDYSLQSTVKNEARPGCGGCSPLEVTKTLVFISLQTHDSKEHLAMMEQILGPLPNHMIKKTR